MALFHLKGIFLWCRVSWGQTNKVSIKARLRVAQSRVPVTVGARNWPVYRRVQTSSGVRPTSYVTGSRDLDLINHSPPSSAKVENEWSCSSTPPCMPSEHGPGKSFPLNSFAQDVRNGISASKISRSTKRVH